MRTINHIVVHWSATGPDQDIGAREIRRWHTDAPPRGRGWTDIGYHLVIRRDGRLEPGRPIEVMGAHVGKHNRSSLGVCYVGGPDAPITRAQRLTLATVLDYWLAMFPGARVFGHRDLAATQCPGFDAGHFCNTGEIRAHG